MSPLFAINRSRPGSAATAAPRPGIAAAVAPAGWDRTAVTSASELGLGLRTWAGPVTADLGGPDPDWRHAAFWWVGSHGGAGLSTLQAAVPGGADANRRWPDPAYGGPSMVVLVARGSAHGLRCLRAALRQYAGGDTPPGLYLVGTAVVADRPGRAPRHLDQQIAMVAGTAPTLWRIPWITDLLDSPDPRSVVLPPALAQLDRDLGCLRPA